MTPREEVLRNCITELVDVLWQLSHDVENNVRGATADVSPQLRNVERALETLPFVGEP